MRYALLVVLVGCSPAPVALPPAPDQVPAPVAEPAALLIGAPFDPAMPPLTLRITCSNGQSCVVSRHAGPLDAPGRVGYTGYSPQTTIPGGVRLATAWSVSADGGQMRLEIVTLWSGGGNPTIPGHGGYDRAAVAGPFPFGSVSAAPLTALGQDMEWRNATVDIQ